MARSAPDLAERTVSVRVPASSANLGPGFDSMGLALGLWDEYDVSVEAAGVFEIVVEGEGASEVPTDESHLVYRSMQTMWAHLGADAPAGLRLRARNGVPHGRGLGSSASAIVAGVSAAAALAGRLDLAEVAHVASRLEGHPDNATASVYGGLTLSWEDDGGRTRTVRPPVLPSIAAVVFVPEHQLATERARKVLPDSVPRRDAGLNSARAALLMYAVSHDPAYLHDATRDWLHQEYRRGAFESSMALVDDLRADGHAAVISGAGPSVLVLTTTPAAVLRRGSSAVDGFAGQVLDIPASGVEVTGIKVTGIEVTSIEVIGVEPSV